MDYDRRASRTQVFNITFAIRADEGVNEAYGAMLNLKGHFDEMEEIPEQYMPTYRQILKTIDVLVKARQETHQTRMMVRKLPG